MKISRSGLLTKMGRVVALQVGLISAAVAAGIYITNTIVEDFLITEALQNEAQHFWALYEENDAQGLPNTANMVGYLAEPGKTSALPQPLKDFQPGFIGRLLAEDG